MIGGAIGVAMGLGGIALGLFAYLSPRAPAYFRRLAERTPYNLAAVYGFIPGGLAFLFIGAALLVNQSLASLFLIFVGVLWLLFALILSWVWHPDWVRPGWMRGRLGD